MIEFKDVSFTYERVTRSRRKSRNANTKPADWGRSPDDRWAIADLSFTLEDGEWRMKSHKCFFTRQTGSSTTRHAENRNRPWPPEPEYLEP